MEDKIEGISPSMLWTFCVVLVGLMALVVLVYKVIEIMRKEHERKVQRQQLSGGDGEKLKKTQSAMNNYLIDRKYREEDWK